MTEFDDATIPEDDDDALRNPGGDAADDEADFHGDRLQDADAIEDDAERS